jgi:YfiH family protein
LSIHPAWLVPDWPAPPRVRAFVTTREGGVSEGAYASMNLGLSSGDAPDAVARNRAIVRTALPGEPAWLAQVHGNEVAELDSLTGGERPRADAAVVSTPGRVAAVLTADCLPVFLTDRSGRRVAVAHAGWRGLAAGVLERAAHSLGVPGEETIAWLGPAIGPDAFEVGAEVREAFMQVETQAHAAFRAHKPGKFMCDLYRLARMRLARAGVRHVYGGGFCTWSETGRFFSYRREQKSGRMGAFVWIMPQ